MSTYSAPHLVNLRSVLLLTVASVLFLSATITIGFAIVPESFLPTLLRASQREEDVGIFRMFCMVGCPLGYLWLCAHLTGDKALRRTSLRYTLMLLLQALIELLLCVATGFAVAAMLDLADGATGATQFHEYLRQILASEQVRVAFYVVLLCLPALSMMVTVWRLHALSQTPGMVAQAVNGTLYSKSLRASGDAGLVRNELARHLERLTGPGSPALGRVMYASHPKMTSRDMGDETVHQLVWLTCPMKLVISAHTLADGGQEVRVRCVLRSGYYQLYLMETPVDAAAQMRYIEAHLLQPLGAQLARLSAERQRDALRDQAVAAQLRILQAQIEPHFLFNTLANVRQLYRSSVADGEAMMDHLIAYLRCAMDELRAEHSSIVKEMDLAAHFLSIMQIRMGDRLGYQFSIPASLLEHAFPPAMLISLVENAIKHGLADRDHGLITLSAARDGHALRVTVADNGTGFSSVGGTGVGLSNIRQRLEAMYGSRAWLEVGAPAAGGFAATIVIPHEERFH